MHRSTITPLVAAKVRLVSWSPQCRKILSHKRQSGMRKSYRPSYQIFSRIIQCTLMNLDAIRGLGLGGQVGHHLTWLPCRYHSSIATNDIRYSLRMLRMELFSRVSSAVQQMLLCSKTFQISFFNTAADGPILNLLWSWIMRHSIIQNGFRRCARVQG